MVEIEVEISMAIYSRVKVEVAKTFSLVSAKELISSLRLWSSTEFCKKFFFNKMLLEWFVFGRAKSDV